MLKKKVQWLFEKFLEILINDSESSIMTHTEPKWDKFMAK